MMAPTASLIDSEYQRPLSLSIKVVIKALLSQIIPWAVISSGKPIPREIFVIPGLQIILKEIRGYIPRTFGSRCYSKFITFKVRVDGSVNSKSSTFYNNNKGVSDTD